MMKINQSFTKSLAFVGLLLFSLSASSHQYSTQVNNARLDAIETTVGASAVLQMRSGSPPANCAAANTGTLLAAMTLPADWMSAAAAGVKSKLGTWEDLSADATGTLGYYRIFNNAQTVCGVQGTVTASGGGGDIIVDSTAVTSGQAVTVVSYTITAANQ